MPPKGPRLSGAEVDRLRAWIDAGASWPPDAAAPAVRSRHWSLQPLPSSTAVLASVPPAAPAGVAPIDAFILAGLARQGLALAPPADRVTLIRRLSFDLTGLPPSPAAMDAFLADRSPRAYEDLVERLLASPHYGERWGRHWLDVVRYTESQGFEYDKLRPNAWHYRDYVIRSFNEDKPYDRFMREQIAGDVLEPVTSEGIVGASLLVCGPWDEAGSSQANLLQRSLTREEEMEDLVGTVGQTFLGLTLNCARCHSHKFDPIPLEEYYRVRSVFDGVKHGERSVLSADEARRVEERKAALERELAAAQAVAARLEAEGGRRAAARRQPGTELPGPAPAFLWSFTGGRQALPAGELQGGAVVSGGRLRLPTAGAFFQSAPLDRGIREKTLEAWVALDTLDQGGGAAISIEDETGRTFDAVVYGERQPRKWMAGSSGFQRTRDLAAPVETAPAGTLLHVAVVYRADHTIAVYRNGQPYGEPYKAGSLPTYVAGQSRVLLGMRHTGGGRPFLTGEIQQAALHDRALEPHEVAASFRAAGLHVSRGEALASLTAAERSERAAALARMETLRGELKAIPAGAVSYAGRRQAPPPARVLLRGDLRSPGPVVAPAGLALIREPGPDFGLAPDAPEAQRRLQFAAWLSDPRHPLPARVMANRIWQFHFGQGLVATPNDFGTAGARPTHPALLDWLAATFIEDGWSVKALHRRIVNSATYRQSATPTSLAPAAARDADNTLLWRFPPRRLEAEAVRDAILAASGQLNPAVGGPSFQPFEILKFPANTYQPVDKIGPEYNRRTVYRMNVNSGKEPLLDTFDCPDPSVKTPRRGVTTTPLQALALMNNAFVQRQAGHLAARAAREAGGDPAGAVRLAHRLTLGREPTPQETRRALAAARERSLTNVCWVLLNSTEFLYVR
jgi:hypothetical protein